VVASGYDTGDELSGDAQEEYEENNKKKKLCGKKDQGKKRLWALKTCKDLSFVIPLTLTLLALRTASASRASASLSPDEDIASSNQIKGKRNKKEVQKE